MKNKRDDELMGLVKKKHRLALEELYDRYIKLVYCFGYKFTNGKEDKTKEIVQLVFLKLWTTKRYSINRHPPLLSSYCLDY